MEKQIADLFKKLLKEKPNVSFVYSFVYSKNGAPVGMVNAHGSKEEIETHIEGLQNLVKEQTEQKQKKYARNTKNK